MAKRGRKEKPLHTVQFRANKHADRMPKPTGDPVRPDGKLSEVGLELWDAVVPELIKLNIATNLDQPQLESLCEWWAEYRHWQSMGYDMEASKHKLRVYKQFIELADKFGLTPAGRRRLRPKAPKEELSPFAEFLKRKGSMIG